MRIDILSREYPPHVYGGAGVHVNELAKVLREHVEVRVRAFDGPRDEEGVTGYTALGGGVGDASLDVLAHNLPMAKDCEGADLVHSHTWYANMAGHLAKTLHGIPHVLSAHSLEPLRPWKAEQLGGGYRVSSWIEKTAYEAADGIIAVSARACKADVLRCYPDVDPAKVHVVHNGIDVDAWAAPATDEEREPRPTPWSPGTASTRTRPPIVFVGRITRQKGLPYFLKAVEQLPEDIQVVLCAGAPDTTQIASRGLVAQSRSSRRRATASSGSRRCCRAPNWSPCLTRAPRSCARRSTSPSASSISRRWRWACPSSAPPRAESPRSWITASRARSCPSTRSRTARAPLRIRRSTRPTLPRR